MNRLALLAALSTAAVASSAYAQHTNFTLLGTPSADGLLASKQNPAVHPISAPSFSDDPFITTDVRLIGMYQNVGNSVESTFVEDFNNGFLVNGGSIPFSGGNVQQYLLQGRVALTSQVQAQVQVGYVDWNTGMSDDSGATDMAVGLKWNFYQDWGNRLHAAVGVGYEFPFASQGLFQNDDELRSWLTVSKGFDRLNFTGTLNYRYAQSRSKTVAFQLPTGATRVVSYPNDGDSSVLSLHLHADYYVNEYFSPVIEFNWYRTTSTSRDGQDRVSGMDLGNYAGNNKVQTLAIGAEFRPAEQVDIRAAFEFPIWADDSLMDWRATYSMTFSF
jgi:hypothetical protein